MHKQQVSSPHTQFSVTLIFERLGEKNRGKIFSRKSTLDSKGCLPKNSKALFLTQRTCYSFSFTVSKPEGRNVSEYNSFHHTTSDSANIQRCVA
jgi:hypothetical protein